MHTFLTAALRTFFSPSFCVYNHCEKEIEKLKVTKMFKVANSYSKDDTEISELQSNKVFAAGHLNYSIIKIFCIV